MTERIEKTLTTASIIKNEADLYRQYFCFFLGGILRKVMRTLFKKTYEKKYKLHREDLMRSEECFSDTIFGET